MNMKKDKALLKIAMLGHKTVPAMDSSRGGIEVVVEELAPRLVEMRCEVTCYNRTGCDNGGLSEYKGVRLKPVPTFKRKGDGDIIGTTTKNPLFTTVSGLA
ncbi:MAG: glycosyltransferase family 4 protein [Lachnospiraceae bacterium]|nr:glycosyltransferase family 4 protein [Lachnospiraceae bacterium]